MPGAGIMLDKEPQSCHLWCGSSTNPLSSPCRKWIFREFLNDLNPTVVLLECAPAGKAVVGVSCEDPSLASCKGSQCPIPCVPVLWVTPSHGSSGACTAVSTPAGSSQGDLEGDFKFSCSMTQL